jgi:hypothetical protein
LYEFRRNEPLRTKHLQVLDTYTFEAPEPWAQLFYSPNSSLHKYKRYSSFPPIKGATLELFERYGLDFEIGRVIKSAYSAMETINTTRTFLSWSPALRVLGQLKYDRTDRVLIVSRNDHPGFWTQSRRSEYLTDLERIAAQDGLINQTRIMIYGQDGLHHMTPTDQDLHQRLLAVHGPNTFYSFEARRLFKYEAVDSLIFGFTLSTKHKYAVIPVPAGEEALAQITPDNIGELLRRYDTYDPGDGPMKAVITANSDFINQLITECQAIIEAPEITRLK